MEHHLLKMSKVIKVVKVVKQVMEHQKIFSKLMLNQSILFGNTTIDQGGPLAGNITSIDVQGAAN